MLSNEKRHLFLELEIYMSRIDGDFSDEEKMIIDTHCIEMHIDNNDYECEFPLDIVLSKISSEFTTKEKHIAFLELVATVLADNAFHKSEQILIDRLSDLFSISDTEVKTSIDLIKKMKEAYEGCADFVKED